MDEERLLELRESHEGAESTYSVEVTDLVDRMALSADALVDWSADEREADPMLVFGPITEAEVSDAAYPRRVYETDGSAFVPVPDELLASAPGGLGLDLESYDDANPLLFEAVAMDETAGLVPARFGDGTPYSREPLPDTPEESDPVAEETIAHADTDADATPRPETVDAPIDPDLVERAVAETDVTPAALVGALEELSRRDLVGEENTAPGYPPLTVDDRAVCIVADDAWETELAPELGVDDPAVLEAAAGVHERQARRLIDEADAEDYEGFDEDRAAVVTDERDTAEWDDAGIGA